ncbi:hypothetical protein Ahy_B01g054450 [Arachis hypogaea]|uniref:Uncharacterized protein n=1 Tax=Arachis hypogaea TaxID=3818 RepID=A0A445ATW2_ARAHY|nr:hypothetical protein Ahy_B01g054450 [Arachis hypogaea]
MTVIDDGNQVQENSFIYDPVKSSFCEADENVRFYIGTPREHDRIEANEALNSKQKNLLHVMWYQSTNTSIRRTWGTQIHWSGHGHFVPWQEFKSSGQNDLGQVANDMKYKAKDAASRATESFKSTASGASEYASQRVADAREAVSGAMGYGRENAGQAYDGDGKIIRMPTDRETDAKIMMQ